VRLVNAMRWPSGDHATSPRPSGIVHNVRVSPGPATGRMCNVESPFFSPRLDVNARNLPSGDHSGLLSCGPAVIGAPSSQIRELVTFFLRSIDATTNAILEPSGDTTGAPADVRPSSSRSAISVWSTPRTYPELSAPNRREPPFRADTSPDATIGG
jgi:hypothetical protein